MDLKNNRITVGELLADPRARRVLMQRFPGAIKLPIVSSASTLTLERALRQLSAYIPQKTLDETVDALRRL